MALSFSLLRLTNATGLQAFTAGAALCSTSLGTTFTVLKSSHLSKSRLGVVLTSAAMMDDVVGLVMVQIISNLKPGGTAVSAATVVRPIFVSLAFASVVPLCCRFIVLPGWRRLESSKSLKGFKQVLLRRDTVFVAHTTLLLGFVTGASFAGASNLFAAYLAGTLISWWDTVDASPTRPRQRSPPVPPNTISPENVPRKYARPKGRQRSKHLQQETDCAVPSEEAVTCDTISESPDLNHAPIQTPRTSSKATQTSSESAGLVLPVSSITGIAVYERYYLALVERLLKPLFFVGPTQDHHFHFCMLNYSSGLCWFLDPNLANVPWRSRLARDCLRLPHGRWQVILWFLACAFRHQL